LSEYQEKIASRLNELVNVDQIKTNVLAETENFLDEVKVRIDRVFDFVYEQINTGEKRVEKAAKDVMDKAEKAVKTARATANKTVKKAQTAVDKAEKELEKEVKKTTRTAKKAVKETTATAKKTVAKAETKAKAATSRAKKVAAEVKETVTPAEA